jgi:sarcosine oxidase, subunit alpha
MKRIDKHPILQVPEIAEITFYFEGMELRAKRGEMISSALFANDIHTFGLHPKDGSPQGIFCANGQCAQCLVIADGLPVKSCMVAVREGMKVHKLVNLPKLPEVDGENLESSEIEELSTDLLIIGAGPAGLGAAIEAAAAGLEVLIVDDKNVLGGKLVLQTHAFFGSVDNCYAGTRGIDIASILSEEVVEYSNIRIMTDTMAVGVYSDSKIGILEKGVYKIVKPKTLLVAAGAREKALTFPGCDLPGVYGAGAFQTLLNRDLVRPSEKLFIVGGGNVGLIAGYHALQVGIAVVGLVEGMSEVSAYWVHADKLKRLGVPIYTSTTVVSANGKDSVESVTVAEVDSNWKKIPGTYRTYPCDTLLIAVGLSSINEIHVMAKKFGIDSYVAGDAEEIAEASAAMFSGRVAGRKIAQKHGKDAQVPSEWEGMISVLKAKPGHEGFLVEIATGASVFPVIRCLETIPCNPCVAVCPKGAITIQGDNEILARPEFSGECVACGKCLTACPGLAITLVDYRTSGPGMARVTLPFEMPVNFKVGDDVMAVEHAGKNLTRARVIDIISKKLNDKYKSRDSSVLIVLEVERDLATQVAGIRIQEETVSRPIDTVMSEDAGDDVVVCRCERVTEGQILNLIRSGVNDMNQLKAMLKVGMGACGGKTCGPLIESIFEREGVAKGEVTYFTERPLVAEVPMGVFAGVKDGDINDE